MNFDTAPILTEILDIDRSGVDACEVVGNGTMPDRKYLQLKGTALPSEKQIRRVDYPLQIEGMSRSRRAGTATILRFDDIPKICDG